MDETRETKLVARFSSMIQGIQSTKNHATQIF